jgi:hypothetical protein
VTDGGVVVFMVSCISGRIYLEYIQAIHYNVYGYRITFANKKMVLTLPARGSFRIIARHKRSVVTQAVFCRSGRGWAAHFRR